MAGFFDTLFGRTAARDATQLRDRSMSRATDFYNTANEQERTGYNENVARWQPWADSGRRGQTAYENTLGINGRDAAQRQFQQSYLDDPALAYRNDANTAVMNQLYRKYNAGPQGINSGAALMGAGRLRSEQFNNDWGNIQGRLAGLGQQGMAATGQLSNLTSNYYGGQANRAMSHGQNLNQIDQQGTQAASNARAQGVNNLMGLFGNLGGMALSAYTGVPMMGGGQRGGGGGGGAPPGYPQQGVAYNPAPPGYFPWS